VFQYDYWASQAGEPNKKSYSEEKKSTERLKWSTPEDLLCLSKITSLFLERWENIDFKSETPNYLSLITLLLLLCHNWKKGGLSAYLDRDHYSFFWSNKDFHAHRQDPDYQRLEAGWDEKRSFLRQAPDHILQLAAGTDPLVVLLATQLKQGLQEIIQPVKPSLEGFSLLPENRIFTTFFDVTIDPQTGGIQRLLQHSPSHVLGRSFGA